MSKADTMKKNALAYVEAVNNRDLESLQKLFATKATVSTPATNGKPIHAEDFLSGLFDKIGEGTQFLTPEFKGTVDNLAVIEFKYKKPDEEGFTCQDQMMFNETGEKIIAMSVVFNPAPTN